MSTTPLKRKCVSVNQRSAGRRDTAVPVPQVPDLLLTPKKLKISPTDPVTPKTSSIYQDAKFVFRRCSTPKRLVGRQDERIVLEKYFAESLLAEKSGSIYLSGCPGTGKTALVNELINDLQNNATNVSIFKKVACKIKFLSVNCMNFTDPKLIFDHILREFGMTPQSDKLLAIQSYFVPKTKKNCPMYCLILDEIDHLVKDKNVLYAFFEWAKLPNSRLVLIGIANVLDLTSRFLPRLSKKNVEPILLSFNPYKVSEIAAIIKERLESLDTLDSPLALKYRDQNDMVVNHQTPTKIRTRKALSVLAQSQSSPLKITREVDNSNTLPTPLKSKSQSIMQPMAIELTARKLAGTGDLRKALDVCRHAIQMAEQEYLLKPSELPPKVTVKHVLEATTTMLGSPIINRIKELCFSAQVMVITMVLMTKERNFSILNVEKKFRVVCKNVDVKVEQSEFMDILSKLEVLGIVFIAKKRGDSIVSLNVNSDDVLKAFDSNVVLNRVLDLGSAIFK